MADLLRGTLVNQLLEAGMVRTPRVETAMRTVPRHVFLPGVPLRRAYANDVATTKRDAGGAPISAASQPSIVGAMLEQLGVSPGDRVLEIGAGTGYNAALLAYLTGPAGLVVTVDVDEDIVAGARLALADAGFPHVMVVRGDGALGYEELSPYDRIIATVGLHDLPVAWRAQLAPGGRIVVPLRLRGSVTRSIAFERADGQALRGVSSEMCGFMPLRLSIASDPRRLIPLLASGDVVLEVQQEQSVDADALAGCLRRAGSTVWTGVKFTSTASTEWLYMWLTCVVPDGIFGMSVRQVAIDEGIVAPMFRWGAMAVVAGDSLAYLTFGADSGFGSGSGSSGSRGGGREVGVVGHGPRGRKVAAEVAEQVRAWDRDYRFRTPSFTVRPADGPGTEVTADGQFTFRTPNNLLTISWDQAVSAQSPDDTGRYPE
jgi:protein-L-isoaspartate(D-aspartate) O-methyltransferase